MICIIMWNALYSERVVVESFLFSEYKYDSQPVNVDRFTST